MPKKLAEKKIKDNFLPGLLLRNTLREHSGNVTSIVWSPDGKTLVSVTDADGVHFWDVETGELRQVLLRHFEDVTSLAWAPSGQAFALGSRSGTIHLRDVKSGRHSWIIKGFSSYILIPIEVPDRQTGSSEYLSGSNSLWNKMYIETQSRFKSSLYDSLNWPWDTEIIQSRHMFERHYVSVRTERTINRQSLDSHQTTRKHSERVNFSEQSGNKDIRNQRQISKTDSDKINCLAWSPDGRTLAWGSNEKSIMLWNIETGILQRILEGHSGPVYSVAWSQDGQILASGSADKTIRLWDSQTGELRQIFEGHSDSVKSIAWSPSWPVLASSSEDTTIRIWNCETGRQTNILEGHTGAVDCVSFSYDGYFLASKCPKRTVLWRSDIWEIAEVLNEPTSGNFSAGAAFQPMTNVLATLSEDNKVIHIRDLDLNVLLSRDPLLDTVRYTNAKVVLVGDTGVGKTGLGIVLTGESFRLTDSTHGRYVWTFDSRQVDLDDKRIETREILLWDLAGQPGYRLIHQLHLNEVSLALIVFDSRSETDPFAGVRYWDRALRQAQRIQGDAALPIKKFLVAARTDRGGVSVSRTRIDLLLSDLDCEEYFETSAKEGWHIAELAEAIRRSIDWDSLPMVSSTVFFERIKNFLIAEKKDGCLLTTKDDLYRSLLKTWGYPPDREALQIQFNTCIGLVEARGLIKRLSFGDLVLLQPELLDAYASAIVNAAREEPDGMGCIAEEDLLERRFRMPKDECVEDKKQEKLLLIATVEDLLRHEIALREQSDHGPYLVFPTEFTREHPDLPDPEGKQIIFDFDGPVLNIYATLAVRLSHSGIFEKTEMWKNAAVYATMMGTTCGMFLYAREGRGELTLFFGTDTSEESRFQFEEYVQAHLRRRALPQSINRRRIFTCPNCGDSLTDKQATRRREQGYKTIKCPVCDTEISLLDRKERLKSEALSTVPEMDRAADERREFETAASTLHGKIETRDFDVFLCHNSEDKPVVKKIGERLKERGILPWLDEWELRPGLPWQQLLEQQIGQIKSVAIFVGKDGLGPWQDAELYAFLRQFVKRRCPVIPVILPNCRKPPGLPIFLEAMTWVDFRKETPEPMEQLVWGITGKRSH